MPEEKKHLPIYGVGPYYGAGVIALTVAGRALAAMDVLNSGKITNTPAVVVLNLLALFLLVVGFLVWKAAAVGKNSIDAYIVKNQLCTTGIYSVVRNPCYSGIMLLCTGVLLFAHNAWLFLLPPVYWLAMTVLMKQTEEKWLTERYGQAYLDYCKKVNRCIPWFPKK